MYGKGKQEIKSIHNSLKKKPSCPRYVRFLKWNPWNTEGKIKKILGDKKTCPCGSWSTRITVVKWSCPFNLSPGTHTETTYDVVWNKFYLMFPRKLYRNRWIKLYFNNQNIYKTFLCCFILILCTSVKKSSSINYLGSNVWTLYASKQKLSTDTRWKGSETESCCF